MIHELFRQSELLTDEVVYTLIRLPSNAIVAGAAILAEIGEAFSALLVDQHEVTLVIPLEAWEEYKHRLPDSHQEGNYRLITFNSVLSLDIIGFMALVSSILEKAQVSIMPYAAFSRDHLLVPENLFQHAWDALKTAQQQ